MVNLFYQIKQSIYSCKLAIITASKKRVKVDRNMLVLEDIASGPYYLQGLICCRYLITKMKSNLSLNSLYYAKPCNEFAGSISALLRPGNTATFEGMLQRWRAVGNTVFDLTGLRFEPQTSRSRDERVTVQPTGRSKNEISYKSLCPLFNCFYFRYFRSRLIIFKHCLEQTDDLCLTACSTLYDVVWHYNSLAQSIEPTEFAFDIFCKGLPVTVQFKPFFGNIW